MTKKQRILILSASVGSGHVKAADALEQAFRVRPDVEETLCDDSLTHTNVLHKQFYSALYKRLSALMPDFLGWWYETSDDPWVSDQGRLIFDLPQALPLINLLRDFKPDAVICTHFMPAGVVSYLIGSEKLNTRLGIVITDFHFHAFWITRAFHWYFVAQEEDRIHMEGLGLPDDHIHVTGIPVAAQFSAPVDRTAILKKHGLRDDLPVLLVAAGALGLSPALAVVKRLLHLEREFQTIVLCGKNGGLEREMRELVAGRDEHFLVLGFSEEVPSLMAASSLLVSKPGGMITAEALARGLPMVILDPIGGQEERNADVLLEAGAAIKCTEVTVLNHKLARLLDNPSRLAAMSDNARRIGHPGAAADIARIVVEEPAPPAAIMTRQKIRALRKRIVREG